MQVVRTELPRLKFLDGCLKLPTEKGSVFAELLLEVAVRRVAGNSTLYSVFYRRPKKKPAETKKSRVSSPLIVTVYQSDLRAKKFRVLLKMKVDVRLTSDNKSHRYGVAVAVDEVAACVFVAYTRDEAPVGRRPVPGTRLLLRRVRLTLAAADARGVRRLQRPGVTRRHQSQSISKIFEARTYFGFNPLKKVMANRLKAEEGVSVQQLVMDEGRLLLFSKCFGSLAAEDDWPVALLELNEKRASIDVRSLPPVGQNSVYGQGRRKYMARLLGDSPREIRANVLSSKPYFSAPHLTKLGPVADAACRRLEDAVEEKSETGQQIVCGRVDFISIWWHESACRGCQVFLSTACNWKGDCDPQVVAVRGLATVAPQPQIVSALFAGQADLSEWQARNTKLGRLIGIAADWNATVCKVSGSWLLAFVSLESARQPPSTEPAILRASLRSILPPKTVCANCHVAIRPSPPDKKKVCKVCHIRGFGKYSWVFGCHFCSAACLRDAWPTHSRLHRTPPIRKWTDDDWQKWRLDNSKQ